MSDVWSMQSVPAATTAPDDGHRAGPHADLPPGPGRPATAASIVIGVTR
ncbi:hypothetical protein J2S43_001700 [Catenuloplanes nepalensis]|uniref:Uncharacterized protein n=1 Tax=Catenuloplanes nepalensis TaxID=587533 RepID=A0ABT9MPH2_9ACTN|nr:hypothetical protein [Catenuloplanes nepalensis]MDP9793188.1 hypothetical protein [Catenuloplanes nepalensis]